MVSTFTPNVQIEEPARGDDVGTWDTPVNNNMTLIDLILGGIATIGLNNSNVILSAAQFRSKQITFNSTLTGSVTITFPTSFTKSYEIQNLCTGSSAFTITLETTATGGQVIAVPPGEIVDVVNDGTNINFKNLGRVGSYWDYGGSSLPAWVSGCSPKQPYLIANGSSFSATTYPGLALVFPGLVLPDTRGRVRFALDQSAGNISSGTGGFNGSSVGATGGAQTVTIAASNVPQVSGSNTISVNSAFNIALAESGIVNQNLTGGGAQFFPQSASGWTSATTLSGTNTITVGSASPAAMTNLPPGVIAGLTLIRAG